MTPLVTIAIPTYRRLGFLQEAVESALQQDYPAVEVLIGDDGPTEVIGAWCRRLMTRNTRVRYQKNDRNLGLAGNWNALADAARGEFIVIIGDDDRLLPAFVSQLVALAGNGSNVAFSNHYLIDESGCRLEAESLEHTRRYHRDQLPEGPLARPEIAIWQNAIPMSAALVRTADARRLRFQEDLNTPEIEFLLRLAREGGRFVFTPEYLAEYRVHPHSATSAGLWSEPLARRLAAFAAAAEVEPHKRAFLEPLLVNAVSRSLTRGNRAVACEFLASPYYPRPVWGRMTGIVQSVFAKLPAFVGAPVYRLLLRLKRESRNR